MFQRNIMPELTQWAASNGRKPLIIRGARQVGKTTVVRQLGEKFEQFISLDLQLPEDRRLFEQFSQMEAFLQSLFFLKNQSLAKRNQTLIFIDEIQELPAAVNLLRYFYEQAPEIAVVAAGSMLETLFDRHISFPVGRVVYKVLRPVSFPEFLAAIGETAALEALETVPFPAFAHDRLLALFHTYAFIGGMPEVVNSFVQHRDLSLLAPIYDALLTSYLDDVEKYAVSQPQMQTIRHAIRAAFVVAGQRIKFQGFGNSNYGSREMAEALRALEKALLIRLIYPDTSPHLPLLPDLKKSPRLQVLDTGLLNFSVGIQREIIGTRDLSTVWQGAMLEHLVGQELLAARFGAMDSLHFWVREKNSSTAELDYLLPFDSKLVPIEVKSGTDGRLKSLHLFMNEAPHDLAVRFFAGQMSVSNIQTPEGKPFRLLNLPYFLVSQTEKHLEWMTH